MDLEKRPLIYMADLKVISWTSVKGLVEGDGKEWEYCKLQIVQFLYVFILNLYKCQTI